MRLKSTHLVQVTKSNKSTELRTRMRAQLCRFVVLTGTERVRSGIAFLFASVLGFVFDFVGG